MICIIIMIIQIIIIIIIIIVINIILEVGALFFNSSVFGILMFGENSCVFPDYQRLTRNSNYHVADPWYDYHCVAELFG